MFSLKSFKRLELSEYPDANTFFTFLPVLKIKSGRNQIVFNNEPIILKSISNETNSNYNPYIYANQDLTSCKVEKHILMGDFERSSIFQSAFYYFNFHFIILINYNYSKFHHFLFDF